MKRLFIFFVLVCGHSHADNGYNYFVNLREVNNDKVNVTLTPPPIADAETDFLFPAVVPGTYERYDFGRFITGFKVTGKNGATIKVTRTDVNTFHLSPASHIEKITYTVDDTFDKSDIPAAKQKTIFEPGGTNFQKAANFSINMHSMFGYFRGHTKEPVSIEFQKPEGFYPSTGLKDVVTGSKKDILRAGDYHELVDSPVMYCKPDTASAEVGGARVTVSCYSPRRLVTAGYILRTLKDLLSAQRDYLGGKLPVDHYMFLFHFLDRPSMSGSAGALEHSYSSFYVLPEFDSTYLDQQIRDIAAHEFFHVVTPLNIHSKEIGDFDFNAPVMSRHLWMYEGLTEYAAHHAQLKGGLIDFSDFLNTMMQKFDQSVNGYNDTMSFTHMSRNVLDKKIHEQYGNVYEKGAVIGMCLDILLRDLSKGAYGTQNLMADLSVKYGKERAFNDEALFSEIESLTYPDVGRFLKEHVEGGKRLPMEDILGRTGIDFYREKIDYVFTLGNADFNYNPKSGRIFVESIAELDTFGRKLGYKKGDELITFNGKELKPENMKELLEGYYSKVKDGDTLSVDVYRRNWLGKKKRKNLSAKVIKVRSVRHNIVAIKPELSEDQKRTLRAWIGAR
jgi:predicted metalloprotease with PDZ domain